jgi:hypothetical protein
MRVSKTSLFPALALALLAGPALAEAPKVYAYQSHANYCPSGLQPVSLNGVICCGKPTADQTYQQAKTHPVTYKTRRTRSARAHLECPVGAKGCN